MDPQQKTEETAYGKGIFVVGNPRSGTTMMGRILGNHALVHTFKELHFFESLWERKTAELPMTEPEAIDLTAKLLCFETDGFSKRGDYRRYRDKARSVLAGTSLNSVRATDVYKAFLYSTARHNGKMIPCEQTPGYVYYIPEILNLFPKAKIINMMRDPRDVLLSQKNKWKRWTTRQEQFPFRAIARTWMNYHPISTSRLWRAAVKTAGTFASSKHVLSVRFEDVLANPTREIRRICEFVGITYDDSMLQVPMVGSSLLSDRPEQKGIDATRTAHWGAGGLSSAETFLCELLAGDAMAELSYEKAAVSPNPFALAYYLITFPLKAALALLLNMREMTNPREAIRRRLLRK